MADIFEIEDERGAIKILKILKEFEQDEELIKRLAQEADVLQHVNHSGIPKVFADEGFFRCSVEGRPDPIYGFVMEKVEGYNLETWLQNQKESLLSEIQAFNWLKQLVEILDTIHQHNFLHRDIKPANIMLRPNGQLVLIDFGIARQMTATFRQQQNAGATGTKYHSSGYAPPEQEKGKADARADFYAVGRTLVHLITGFHPFELALNPESDRLHWRAKAPHISADLADLLDWMMQRDRNLRPRTAQHILQAIAQLHAPPRQRLMHRVLRACGYGVVIGGVVVGIRLLGLLQPIELAAFDLTMQIRAVIAPELPDSRLVIITIDEQDLVFQNAQGMQFSRPDQTLSDTALEQLLTQLNRYQPAVIGLDIYRDAVTPSHLNLATRLKKDSRLIGVCLSKNSSRNQTGEVPPPEVPPERLGLTDFVKDQDNVIRRQILFGRNEARSACQAVYTLSSRVALEYLTTVHQLPLTLPDNQLQVADVVFTHLKSRTGAYQNLSNSAQILLNYRSMRSPNHIAQSIPLRDVLDGKFHTDLITDRIVLIGATMKEGDRWTTPFSQWHSNISGVMIHAHMTSQLLSTVLDHRPSLWTWAVWQETLWIVSWSIVGTLLAKRTNWQRILILVSITGCIVIVLCSLMLVIGGWLPSVPAILGFSFVLMVASGNQYLVTAQLHHLLKRS